MFVLAMILAHMLEFYGLHSAIPFVLVCKLESFAQWDSENQLPKDISLGFCVFLFDSLSFLFIPRWLVRRRGRYRIGSVR